MLAVYLALRTFLLDLKGHHENMAVVSYKNHQGSLRSRPLYKLVRRLLLWAQPNLRFLRASHVPGRLNQGADMLPRGNVSLTVWILP